jgi:hypothetical protein
LGNLTTVAGKQRIDELFALTNHPETTKSGVARSVTSNDYRSLFLQSVARVHGDVLTTLRKEVFPKYKRFAKHPAASIPANARNLPVTLRHAIRGWAGLFNLSDEWCMEVALNTLKMWTQCPSQARLLRWSLPGNVSTVKGAALRFEFSDEGWRSEAWSQFEARILKRTKQLLRDYRKQIGGDGPEKRDLRHLDWLALYQCKGQTYSQIANRVSKATADNIGEDTVRKAVHGTASLIGLTLRAGKRGPRAGENRTKKIVV